jgi:hypothetical protein
MAITPAVHYTVLWVIILECCDSCAYNIRTGQQCLINVHPFFGGIHMPSSVENPMQVLYHNYCHGFLIFFLGFITCSILHDTRLARVLVPRVFFLHAVAYRESL